MLAVAFVAPLILSHAQQTSPTQQKPPTSKKQKGKASNDVTKGEKLSIQYVLQMLEREKAGTMAETRVLEFVDVRGIAFVATPENVGALMSAGASEDLLKKIIALNPPPAPATPPPPPPPVTGTLQLKCEPVECNVRIDGGPDKPTKDGKVDIGDLPYKDYTVDFRKDGYLPQSKRVKVAAGTQPEIAVVLEVGAETRTRWGSEMYKNLLKAIGGANGLAEFKGMSGTGSASSWDTAGVLSEWSIKTAITGNTYTYDLSNALSGSFAMSCQSETCGQKNSKSPFGKKKLNAVEAAALNTNLVQYNRYHLLALLERISGENHVLSASTAPLTSATDQHLIVDSRDETYNLTLDGNFLPSAVTYKSKDGLASATITYGQYAAFEKGSKYPKHTSVLLPGDIKHGIQVHYETLTTK